MRVCFIATPSPFLLDERVFPFLGILKLPPVLARNGIASEVLDLSGLQNYLDVLSAHAIKTTATHFGITATTPQFPAAVRIAKKLREVRPDARIIIGGTHATLIVAGMKKGVARAIRSFAQLEKHFDVIVSGDGERTIIPALAYDAPKLIDADVQKSPLRLLTNDTELEDIIPDRSLIDLDSYRYFIDGARATSLIAQLGCPYKCGFCAGRSSPMLRNLRTRSAQSVVAEMLHIYNTWGIDGIMFYDDELNVRDDVVLELMRLIAKTGRDNGIEWKLRGFVKSERFTDTQAKAMHEAGFRQILVGFESGSSRILENIQKIATQSDNTRCMDIARNNGLKVKALMSLGHPGESPETAEETRKWIIDVRPSDFDVTVITPYAGSPYYDEALPDGKVFVYTCKNGDRLFQEEVNYELEADYYKGDPEDGYVSHVWTPDLTQSDLVRTRNFIESSVRETAGIAFNPKRESQMYEHSMGQTVLPSWILRQ
jgi:anaerobic magnesium-protoporphyrin IX monomethyl ester cyclase